MKKESIIDPLVHTTSTLIKWGERERGGNIDKLSQKLS